MKKKLLSVLLSTAMVAALLVGCTNDADTGADAPADGGDATVEDGADDGAADSDVPEWVEPTYEYSGSTTDDGTVLNIYCWNDEFYRRVRDHYPGFVEGETDEATGNISGEIDGTKVVFYITANADNAYQNNLDTHLAAQDSASAEDKIDIFLIEADYALKYVDTNASLALSDLGITDADVANQYQYTKDVVTDMHGQLKGSSWQGCPGVLIYNRAAATEVLGSDDPATVQEAVKDWDAFNATAAQMKEAGYSMTATVYDTYRVYSNNVTSKWVESGVINVDDNIAAWVEDAKAMVDNGYSTTYDLWSDEWSKGFYPDGKVFAYFGPAWLVNFSMAADTEGSIGYEGGWGACKGPQGFYWGGTWMCAANGTDNATLVKNLIVTMTTDEAVLEEIVLEDDDFANNTVVMDKIAASDYQSAVFGGQNPIGTYAEGVSTVDLSNISKYDQGCNETFQACMKEYFLGNQTYDEAYAEFVKQVIEKYPELEMYN
ncbi:MAG: carbohydrate ABC transporter substrate-binding protein [Lachnospiraceae bacterium]|nr:carbohydrate ABC transporter substrate-binding protein [Lachnospiraceae bacterium]